MKKIIPLIVLLIANVSFGQDFGATIKSYFQQNQKELKLDPQDFSEISISSQSYSKSLEAYNVYAEQNYRGIKVFNSVSPFVVKDNRVLSANPSFSPSVSAKINSSTPSISAIAAISKAAVKLGVPTPTELRLLETVNDYSYVFSDGNISLENIPVQLVYLPINEGQSLKLAWDLSIYLLDGSHYYSVRVDAISGNLLDIQDWVVSCDFGEGTHIHTETGSVLFTENRSEAQAAMNTTSPQYRVFPIPLIGPHDGPDQLILDPSDATASPYGWHDIDGVAGHEYTSTQGNNVMANEDTAGNNVPGDQAQGGDEMVFDFEFGLPQAPENYLEGAITNLFYMNNIMHDVFYRYGFDEASGNFQMNNYDRGGDAGDFVIADAQDGSGMNNANFSTGSDGIKGRMQMYLWNPPGLVLGTFFSVNDGPLAGSYYSQKASFGPPLPTTPITEDLVLVEDDGAGENEGCGNILNPGDLDGKIAVVRRGNCGFTIKVLSAQEAGAIAVVVVNNTMGDPINMGGTEPDITIPSVMLYQEDGEDIITALNNGETINATLQDDGSGVDSNKRDGDLDNMIVAHEYGHGISIRLTGGRLNPTCLYNQEQMGEGWSDYFALMLTMKPGDAGEDVRGVGTYSIGEGIRGTGIRAKPYSTDFGVNDFTYNSIKTQQIPHGVGSVWATMLWDLTWAFIDEYGFDPDLYEGTGGNNMALQLVVDALKIQRCGPGFVDGRDAILEADEIANGGANKCLIWHAFAKRGLGFSADQGSNNNKMDGTEAFDVPQECSLGVGSEDNIKNKFVVYPNPSNGMVNIQSRFDVREATVSIYDMNGRKVLSQELELHHVAKIDASSLNAGIYMVQIEGGGYSQTSKLIIN